jgi:hypothetical protein
MIIGRAVLSVILSVLSVLFLLFCMPPPKCLENGWMPVGGDCGRYAGRRQKRALSRWLSLDYRLFNLIREMR